MYLNNIVCPRCNGQKYIKFYSHVADGVCFLCKGVGFIQVKEDKPREDIHTIIKDLKQREKIRNKILSMNKKIKELEKDLEKELSIPNTGKWLLSEYGNTLTAIQIEEIKILYVLNVNKVETIKEQIEELNNQCEVLRRQL
ncbi:MAG TPA: hypothetical protein DEG71_10335 [Clostridiales bacterium]|nr:hypothetical protein [Clostridiales bacterium]